MSAYHADPAEWIMMPSADESQITSLVHRLRELTEDITRFAEASDARPAVSLEDGYATKAALLLRQRQARRRFLPNDLFREPGWDMLLTVYVADCERHPTNVKALILSVDSPSATAQRWIDHLDRLGLVLRTTDPLDRRRVEVSMSGAGRTALEDYLNAMPNM